MVTAPAAADRVSKTREIFLFLFFLPDKGLDYQRPIP